METLINQLKSSDYRRNSDKHPADWEDIDLSSLSENLVVRLNIKHPDSSEPERMLVVVDGYVSTYYNVEDGEIFQTIDLTPEPVAPETITDLTKDELSKKVYELQDHIMTPNFAALIIGEMRAASKEGVPLTPKAQIAADWLEKLWYDKYYTQLATGAGPYSFTSDGVEDLTVGFVEVRTEIESA